MALEIVTFPQHLPNATSAVQCLADVLTALDSIHKIVPGHRSAKS